MKFIKYSFITLSLLIALLIAASFFLPDHVEIERSTDIEASAIQIMPYLDSPQEFNKWSPWAKIDPDTLFTFSGPDRGVGASLQWQSENQNVGTGNWVITEIQGDELVRMRLEFGSEDPCLASYHLSENDGSTTVTWKFEMDTGMNPVTRWMGLAMDSLVGPSYEAGLANLKGLVEENI